MSPLPVRVEMKASDCRRREQRPRLGGRMRHQQPRRAAGARGAPDVAAGDEDDVLPSGESDGSNMAGWPWRAVAKRRAVKNVRMGANCTSGVVEFIDGFRIRNRFPPRSPMALVERRDGKDEEADTVGARRLLEETRTPYAIIGGVALQIHHPDPRTTIDIDLAVPSRDSIPRDALAPLGFRHSGSFEHSDNWVSPDGTPVQFSDDPPLTAAISSADEITLDGVALRVMNVVDLLHGKIRSGNDPARAVRSVGSTSRTLTRSSKLTPILRVI